MSAQVANLMTETVQKCGGLDFLVNNGAWYHVLGAVHDANDADWRDA